MKHLLIAINFETIEELEEKIERYILNDCGAHVVSGVEEVTPGVFWDDDGVTLAWVEAESISIDVKAK